MELRDYQAEAVKNSIRGFRDHRRQMICVSTGGGKTVIFSEIARRMVNAPDRKRRIMVIAHRDELISQAVAKIEAHTGIRPGVDQAHLKPKFTDWITVASVQTLINSHTRYPENWFDLIVIDECHHALAKTYQTPLTYFGNHARILGVTATPHPKLGRYFEFMPFSIGLIELINLGYLVPITVRTFPIAMELEALRPKNGDFSKGKLSNALEPFLAGIAARLGSSIGTRKTLIFTPLRQTSIKLVECLQTAGITAAHVDGDSANRKEILAAHGR